MLEYKENFTLKIGGQAGFGIMSAVNIFSKISARSGYHIFDYVEYPSLIRGGHNVAQVTISSKPVHSPGQTTDYLIALDQNTIDKHWSELKPGSFLIFDSEYGMKTPGKGAGIFLVDIPFHRISEELGGTILMRNVAVLGVTLALMGGELEFLKAQLTENFSDKDEKIIQQNHAVCQAGYEYVQKNYSQNIQSLLIPKEHQESRAVMTANDAVVLGALNASLKFAAIYPMTPTSGILHSLAPLQEKFNFICLQPEDEISCINMAIGASYAGARSMVATSGGGFCLMTEGLGLAGMTETPLVIIEGQRGGPSTGLPTWTEQGDLRFVLHAGQGSFPRIVLAPGDVEETFDLTREAFDLADEYQTPVIIILDKHLCESHIDVALFDFKNEINRGKNVLNLDRNYARYKITEDGISPRSFPGLGNQVFANSDEHNQDGYSDEGADNRKQQMEKRMKKLEICAQKNMPKPKLYGSSQEDTMIVSWGSNKGAILDAMEKNGGFSYLHLNWLNPFPEKEVKRILSSAKRIVCVENSYSNQLAGLLMEKTGIQVTSSFLKYDGRPIYAEDIINLVK